MVPNSIPLSDPRRFVIVTRKTRRIKINVPVIVTEPDIQEYDSMDVFCKTRKVKSKCKAFDVSSKFKVSKYKNL